ncbi:MAG TPA: sodium:proton antiporter [Polyangiaceae bacterium]|nr:sodium:proton antiporter [Polyangiaceae bacterium]
MSFLAGLACAGGLLLIMGLAAGYLKRLPISTSAIYLLLGLAIGPVGFNWLVFSLRGSAEWMERLCEIAVAVSLFIGGLKMRLPLRHPAWSPAYILAGPVMLVTVAGVALFARASLGLAAADCLLLGSILAPTDPVLASAVSVNDARDQDRMRYGLSGEAGFNDGIAMPLVMLALLWREHASVGGWVWPWVLQHVAWAMPAGCAIGFLMGSGIGQLAVRLRSRLQEPHAPSDFLALALILLSYVAAEAVSALGFLAVFAAGVGLRHAERKIVAASPHPNAPRTDGRKTHPPAEDLATTRIAEEQAGEPAVAVGVLVAETTLFGDTVERLLEVMLVLLVGASLVHAFSLKGVLVALFLFLLLRPLATLALLAHTETTWRQRWLMGWFGIRGIGSLYYVSYALNRGVSDPAAHQLTSVTLSVIATSILLHGVSAQPLLTYYEKALKRRRERRPA